MEEVLQWIQKLLVDYGAVNVIIMVLAIILTNLIKRPIVKKADSFVESAKKLTGIDVDKSVITSFLCIIPIVLCFIFYFFYGLIQIDWKIAELDWSQVLSNAVVYGMLSISIFETVKGFVKAYISKKSYNEAKKQIEESKTDSLDETTDLLNSDSSEESVTEETNVVLEESNEEVVKQPADENTAEIQKETEEQNNG